MAFGPVAEPLDLILTVPCREGQRDVRQLDLDPVFPWAGPAGDARVRSAPALGRLLPPLPAFQYVLPIQPGLPPHSQISQLPLFFLDI